MFIKLALDENGYVKVTEDETPKPLYINDKGEEVPVDPPAMYQKIIELGTEAKTNREGLEEVQKKFSALDDVEDIGDYVEKAKKAIEQVADFDDKDWMDVKKVESLKVQMKEAHSKELSQVKLQFEERDKGQEETIVRKNDQIRKLMVSNRFSNSPLFTGADPKTSMSPDVAEAFFGHHFKVEDDDKNGDAPVVRAYFLNGDPVISISPERVGELANFDEAISILFDQYPNRDQYIRGTGKGSGAGGGDKGVHDETDLGKLQAQYTEAEKNRNTTLMIALKNKMTALKQSSRRSS